MLGHRLRSMRQTRNLSLDAVAQATGISTSFLSHVETGKGDITVSRLMRVLAFYGVSIGELLTGTEVRSALVVRASERRHLHARGGVELYLLASDESRGMMPVLSIYDPGDQTVEYARHEGEEFAWVLSGRIVIEFDDGDRIELETGDGAYFDSERPHIYRNEGQIETQVLSVVSPPSL